MGRPRLGYEHEWTMEVPGSAGQACGSPDRIEGSVGLPKKNFTGGGKSDAPAVSVEQLDAEPPLQLLDRARERRLCDPEPSCSPSVMQLLGNGDKVAKLTGLKIVHDRTLPVIHDGYHGKSNRYWTTGRGHASIDLVNETKTALITGANKGIGLAIARGLGTIGFTVAVGSRDHARGEVAVNQLLEAGINAFGVALDVTSDSSIAAAAAAIEDAAGRLDVLVNNAGISGRTDGEAQDPTKLDLDVVRTVLDTNVFGVVRVTNAMLPLLYRARSPRIVNVSSNMGSLTLQTGPIMAAYAPSKSMLNSITVQYARRLTDTSVIVNACCPGYVATDFTGFNSSRTPEQGAAIAVRLATLPDDGPRGGFFDDEGTVPW